MALFTTHHTALTRAIAGMDEFDLRDAVGETIFKRGERYYAEGAVEAIAYTDEDTIEATVSGSEFYGVVIYRDDNEIDADCDCPFDGCCKHVVAVLLEAIREGASVEGFRDAKPRVVPDVDAEEGDTKQSGGKIAITPAVLGKTGDDKQGGKQFQEYIASLSLEELRELVLRYAPEEFRRAALAQALSVFRRGKSSARRSARH